MELLRVDIGLPVLRLVCEASITMRGAPTVFERMVLRMTDSLGRNTAYNRIPIIDLFRDFLGVADPNQILTATIGDLVSIDVLRCRGDPQAIAMVCLDDIEITDRGRQILNDGRLPFVSRAMDLEIHYDPIRRRRIWPHELSAVRQSPPKIHLDATLFEHVWPEEFVRQQFNRLEEPRTSGRMSLEGVRLRDTEILWLSAPAIVTIEGERFCIRIDESDSKEVNSYLNDLPDETVLDRILIPALIGDDAGKPAMSEWQKADLIEIGTLTDGWQAISHITSDAMRAAKVLMLDVSSIRFESHQDPGRGQLTVCYDPRPGGSQVEITWLNDFSDCLIIVNRRYPFENAVLATSKSVAKVGTVRIQGTQGRYRFPLAIQDGGPDAQEKICSARAQLLALLDDKQPQDLDRIIAFWEQ